ncbi:MULTISPECIES: hypothetical protein [unclassified Roseibium]|uniref:hypothetical protein n=1 Tax=unclassified Roseibium TaxID=2629323 RepID=UPI00273EE416|nr:MULTISPECIES: hypothetical protein [unclassified Roseibium]
MIGHAALGGKSINKIGSPLVIDSAIFYISWSEISDDAMQNLRFNSIFPLTMTVSVGRYQLEV